MCSQHEREAGMMLSTLPAEWLVVGGSARGGFLQELSLVSLPHERGGRATHLRLSVPKIDVDSTSTIFQLPPLL